MEQSAAINPVADRASDHREILANVGEQPGIYEVLAALERMQPFLPGPIQVPTHQTQFGLGANPNP